ncbi:MAG: invasion associated locus B family protein [Methyloceanibacter sp.]|jgi:invasion protein IalB
MRLSNKISVVKIAGGAALCLLAITSGAFAQTLQQGGATGEQPSQKAAPAEPEPAQPAWVVNCGDNQGKLDCLSGQSVFIKTTGQRLLSVAVRVPPDTKKPIMLLQVPLGVYLPAGVSLRIGKDAAKTLPFKVCDQGGCMAEYAVTEPEIAAMLKGAGLTISAQNQNQQPAFTVTVPVTGFPAAYAKIK